MDYRNNRTARRFCELQNTVYISENIVFSGGELKIKSKISFQPVPPKFIWRYKNRNPSLQTQNAFLAEMLILKCKEILKNYVILDESDKMFLKGLLSFLSFFSTVSRDFNTQMKNPGAVQTLLLDDLFHNFNYRFERKHSDKKNRVRPSELE